MTFDELYANYCIYCNTEIAPDKEMCDDCQSKQINQEDELAEDDRIFRR